MDGKYTRAIVKIGRVLSEVVNRLIPGKIQADALIVANNCTRKALPRGYRGEVYEVVESGVDLSIWTPRDTRPLVAGSGVRFVFSGRFVELKGISFLVEAFRNVTEKTDASLELIGDGEMRPEIEKRISEMRIDDKIIFHGWKSMPEAAEIIRKCDIFVMPSLRECGGSAILEAMALGLPVIATNWAGPSNYVAESSGLLVDPLSKEEFIRGLTDAMLRLAEAPELRRSMGLAGIERVKTCYFDWDSKADRVLAILKETLRSRASYGVG
jgi:glycosyltransferase involved in cell wall biosynthesis